MSEKITKWQAVDYLETPAEIAEYLNIVLEENDATLLQAALGDVAKARGMSAVAKEIGVGRESLYKSLSKDGNPSWQTLNKVLETFGLRLRVAAASA